MSIRNFPVAAALLLLLQPLPAHSQFAEERVPEPLRPWIPWALWGSDDRLCPPQFDDSSKREAAWPSRLALSADSDGARFEMDVVVFRRSWVALPGGGDTWPGEVGVERIGSAAKAVPVIVREHRPSVFLGPGEWKISGVFRWPGLPERLLIPPSTGLLDLRINNAPSDITVWDEGGTLWLRRDTQDKPEEKNFLSLAAFALLEDGIPMRLQMEIQLLVSGVPREENLGVVLPAGWNLDSTESPLPVVVDETGRLLARVKTGKWTIRLGAFRTDNPDALHFAEGAAFSECLIGFRPAPALRILEISGVPPVDVAQTIFPERWRDAPVYRWETGGKLSLTERMRGMGGAAPGGLAVSREWWLSENGQSLTFRDHLRGSMQRIWRLDAAPGQTPGAVSAGGRGLLITENPIDGRPGVEIRERQIDLLATGEMRLAGPLSAIGWQADADSLNVQMHLPPGWRLFALFGADRVDGDWLTSWSLLDLFLLLLFTLAVHRIFGLPQTVLAFVAFGLAYHEPGAPRFLWLALLAPVAILRVVHHPSARKWLSAWKWLTAAALIVALLPFVSAQVQQAIFPQLEKVPAAGVLPLPASAPMRMESAADGEEQKSKESYSPLASLKSSAGRPQQSAQNLAFDPNARIQAGPGVPQWRWQSVSFGWNGPVGPGQTVEPILIPMGLGRFLSVLRILLLIALAAVLLELCRRPSRRPSTPPIPGVAPSAALLALLLFAFPARAQLPDSEMLELLRERLLDESTSFPQAAEIASASLRIDGRQISILCEIHAAQRVAVPLPGRLPAWSPVSVQADRQEIVPLRRMDGSLWVVVPEGVHRVAISGMLPAINEWEWAFALRPRHVEILAPGWTVTGVRPDGSPENQVIFSRSERAAGETTFDHQEFQSLAQVRRTLEIGLVWRVRTEVRRLTPQGRPISLHVPLLAGENVLTQNVPVTDGTVEVQIGAREETFAWESELPSSSPIELMARPGERWVERWELLASAVWNVSFSGLSPIYEERSSELLPVWHPWPGESASIAVSRPVAIAGPTVAIDSVNRSFSPGARQSMSSINLSLRASLGGDFFVGLVPGAQVTELSHNGRALPVRIEDGKVVFSLLPGPQQISLSWRTEQGVSFSTSADPVLLPMDSANLTTQITVPASRWVLWADGPLRGPAVRFWTVLVCSLLAAWALSRIPASPLKAREWMLLALGLTQVPLPAALFVVAWLFFLAWRGRDSFRSLAPPIFNPLQILLILATLCALGTLVGVVAAGLLGNPEMFIAGNGSSAHSLVWFAGASTARLPETSFFSISVWWYRLLMLLWALWLAAALLRWLRIGWANFTSGAVFLHSQKSAPSPKKPSPSQTATQQNPETADPPAPPPLPHEPS